MLSTWIIIWSLVILNIRCADVYGPFRLNIKEKKEFKYEEPKVTSIKVLNYIKNYCPIYQIVPLDLEKMTEFFDALSLAIQLKDKHKDINIMLAELDLDNDEKSLIATLASTYTKWWLEMARATSGQLGQVSDENLRQIYGNPETLAHVPLIIYYMQEETKKQQLKIAALHPRQQTPIDLEAIIKSSIKRIFHGSASKAYLNHVHTRLEHIVNSQKGFYTKYAQLGTVRAIVESITTEILPKSQPRIVHVPFGLALVQAKLEEKIPEYIVNYIKYRVWERVQKRALSSLKMFKLAMGQNIDTLARILIPVWALYNPKVSSDSYLTFDEQKMIDFFIIGLDAEEKIGYLSNLGFTQQLHSRVDQLIHANNDRNNLVNKLKSFDIGSSIIWFKQHLSSPSDFIDEKKLLRQLLPKYISTLGPWYDAKTLTRPIRKFIDSLSDKSHTILAKLSNNKIDRARSHMLFKIFVTDIFENKFDTKRVLKWQPQSYPLLGHSPFLMGVTPLIIPQKVLFTSSSEALLVTWICVVGHKAGLINEFPSELPPNLGFVQKILELMAKNAYNLQIMPSGGWESHSALIKYISLAGKPQMIPKKVKKHVAKKNKGKK